MTHSKQLIFALGIFCVMPALAQTQLNKNESRGELLYAAHCSACHTAEIHWRKQKLATDWYSLVTQVRRWQASIGLVWNKEEIDDVARYLNALHYGFLVPELESYSQDRKPDQLLRR